MRRSYLFFLSNLSPLFIVALFLLSGCSTFSPHTLGVSDAEWVQYEKVKQKELKEIYNEKYLPRFGEKAEENKENVLLTNKGALLVRVFGGKAMLPPFVDRTPYKPGEALVMPGACSEIVLNAIDNANNPVSLQACYLNDVLHLDPSRYVTSKMPGTKAFRYSPLWEDGFVYYGINTDGYVRLQSANVKITKQK